MFSGVDADEQEICNYLKQWPKQFVSGREICRRAAGKHRYREDPYWANQPLVRLVERRVLETDSSGHFRLIPDEKKDRAKKWVSPQLQKILEESGEEFPDVFDLKDSEDSEPPKPTE